MGNKILTMAMLTILSQAYAGQPNIGCDSTCMPSNPSMIATQPKINTSTTTYNAGTVSWGGKCGASNGSILTSAPTSFLCDSGVASSVVTTSNGYTWSCKGGDGTVSQCSASQRVVGTCGSDNGGNVTYPTNLCSAGTPSAISTSGNLYSWTCTGNYGSPAACSAAVVTTTGVWTFDHYTDANNPKGEWSLYSWCMGSKQNSVYAAGKTCSPKGSICSMWTYGAPLMVCK